MEYLIGGGGWVLFLGEWEWEELGFLGRNGMGTVRVLLGCLRNTMMRKVECRNGMSSCAGRRGEKAVPVLGSRGMIL
jgi:hypothetical protein